jgi:hypothetical protein
LKFDLSKWRLAEGFLKSLCRWVWIAHARIPYVTKVTIVSKVVREFDVREFPSSHLGAQTQVGHVPTIVARCESRLEMPKNFSKKITNITLHENVFTLSRIVTRGRMDVQTDKYDEATGRILLFNSPKNES